jgi:hypothetical protein
LIAAEFKISGDVSKDLRQGANFQGRMGRDCDVRGIALEI